MPTRPPTVCATPGCDQTTTRGPRCPTHTRATRATWVNPTHKKIYNSARWQELRRQLLRDHPWCNTPGCPHPATDADHIQPLATGGQPYDPANLQGLCKQHHSQKTAQETRRVVPNPTPP
jgi:5-methylcytosine-specific restriction enzyme A